MTPTTLKEVTITCDGSGTRRGHPGGYAAVLRFGEHVKEVSGGSDDTTNNGMELSAAIAGLQALKTKCRVTVRSDSEYVVLGISEGRAAKWRANGWKKKAVCNVPAGGYGREAFTVTGGMREVANADLWKTLLELVEAHECTFVWVRGHNGDPDNERCDELAGEERAKRLPVKAARREEVPA